MILSEELKKEVDKFRKLTDEKLSKHPNIEPVFNEYIVGFLNGKTLDEMPELAFLLLRVGFYEGYIFGQADIMASLPIGGQA